MNRQQHHYGVVALIMIFWFVISFITNIIGPLIPDIIDNFRLAHLALAGFIPTSFFVAYAVMSIPAGLLIERFSQKAVLTAGFLLPLIGSLLFALNPSFPMLLASSFTIGLGMAMLQTTINPLTRSAGGEENFAFFSVMGQLVFGAASFVSPFVYTSMVQQLTSGGEPHGIAALFGTVTPADLPWVSLYWLLRADSGGGHRRGALRPFPRASNCRRMSGAVERPRIASCSATAMSTSSSSACSAIRPPSRESPTGPRNFWSSTTVSIRRPQEPPSSAVSGATCR